MDHPLAEARTHVSKVVQETSDMEEERKVYHRHVTGLQDDAKRLKRVNEGLA